MHRPVLLDHLVPHSLKVLSARDIASVEMHILPSLLASGPESPLDIGEHRFSQVFSDVQDDEIDSANFVPFGKLNCKCFA